MLSSTVFGSEKLLYCLSSLAYLRIWRVRLCLFFTGRAMTEILLLDINFLSCYRCNTLWSWSYGELWIKTCEWGRLWVVEAGTCHFFLLSWGDSSGFGENGRGATLRRFSRSKGDFVMNWRSFYRPESWAVMGLLLRFSEFSCWSRRRCCIFNWWS